MRKARGVPSISTSDWPGAMTVPTAGSAVIVRCRRGRRGRGGVRTAGGAVPAARHPSPRSTSSSRPRGGRWSRCRIRWCRSHRWWSRASRAPHGLERDRRAWCGRGRVGVVDGRRDRDAGDHDHRRRPRPRPSWCAGPSGVRRRAGAARAGRCPGRRRVRRGRGRRRRSRSGRCRRPPCWHVWRAARAGGVVTVLAAGAAGRVVAVELRSAVGVERRVGEVRRPSTACTSRTSGGWCGPAACCSGVSWNWPAKSGSLRLAGLRAPSRSSGCCAGRRTRRRSGG